MQEPHDLIKDFIDEKLQGNLMVLPNSLLKEIFYYLNGRFIFQVLR